MTPGGLLVPAFFFTALLYAMVGFGGGSTYAALLALTDLDYRLLPVLVLVCNVIVVTGGVYQYAKAGLINLKFLLPLVLASVPCALIGGAIEVPQRYFLLLLGLALLVSGILLVWRSDTTQPPARLKSWSLTAPLLGAVLGFVAGLVGIGGGIFLAPIMHHMRLAESRHIAATASFFILVNSLAGLVGQLSKHSMDSLAPEQFGHYLWLPLAVLAGGQIGSRISARRLSGPLIKTLTGVLVITVGCRLLWQNVSI